MKCVEKIAKQECDVCGRTYQSKQGLKTHRDGHFFVFRCQACLHTFTTEQGLRIHMKCRCKGVPDNFVEEKLHEKNADHEVHMGDEHLEIDQDHQKDHNYSKLYESSEENNGTDAEPEPCMMEIEGERQDEFVILLPEN